MSAAENSNKAVPSDEHTAHLALVSLARVPVSSGLEQVEGKRKNKTQSNKRSVKARTADGLGPSALEGDEEICHHPGCPKSSRGYTKGLCRAHGGHTRCKHSSGCTKKSQLRGLCTAHGGGKRCQNVGGECTKLAKGKGGLCFEHGGGTACAQDGCTMRARVNRLVRLTGLIEFSIDSKFLLMRSLWSATKRYRL
jgi:hypothetical protein